jgi:hypothetical protein
MAQLEPRIFSILTGYTAVAAVVGTRVYPLVLPQKAEIPAISYLRVDGVQDANLSGNSGMEAVRVQVDCWGRTYAQAKGLAADVADAMASGFGNECVWLSDRDQYEDGAKVFRVILEFSIHNER